MGAVKQLMLKELEDARVELEEILALVEKCVAVEGYIPVDTLQQIADLFSAYAKVWPKEDMRELGDMLARYIQQGRDIYDWRKAALARKVLGWR